MSVMRMKRVVPTRAPWARLVLRNVPAVSAENESMSVPIISKRSPSKGGIEGANFVDPR